MKAFTALQYKAKVSPAPGRSGGETFRLVLQSDEGFFNASPEYSHKQVILKFSITWPGYTLGEDSNIPTDYTKNPQPLSVVILEDF